MLDSFLKYITDNRLFKSDDRILLAVSGGLDSTVMARLFQLAGFHFALAHCNFHLRGDESDRDEKFVRNLAEHYHVPVFVTHFETVSYARKHKISIQMAAREMRYRWFGELLSEQGFDFIATAHHLDDQIETFFVNLARGTGIAGLHGILPEQGRIIRPMLFATRKDIESYAMENGVDYVEDSSNSSLKYARNRIRHKVIPQLEKINPSVRQAILDTIERVRDAEAIYRSIVEKEKSRLLIPDSGGYKIPVGELKILAPLRTWLHEILSDFSFSGLALDDIMDALDRQPGKVFFSSTHQLIKDRDYLLIHPRIMAGKGPMVFEVFPYPVPGLPICLEFSVLKREKANVTTDPNSAFLDYDQLTMPLYIRKWRKGDYFYPFGMKKRKKLSDFFIDQKFSLIQKENAWLLCSGDEIVWIIGKRPDNRFRVTDSTRSILEVRWVK